MEDLGNVAKILLGILKRLSESIASFATGH